MGQDSNASGGDSRGPERRTFARIEVDLLVELQFEDVHQLVRSQTLDIAVGGAFVRTQSPREPGTVAKLRLMIGGDPMTLAGQIVRAVYPGEGTTPGMGIRFTDLTPEQARFLAALVEARKRENAP